MAEDRKPVLRIYCVCGKKMKVTEAMLGRPAKCVACRQKIRIPRGDEIPAGVSEIRLTEHPEFLRAAAPANRSGRNGDEVVPEIELAESEDVPLDELESLKILCSIEQAASDKRDGVDLSERTLRKARRARAELDRQMKQRLAETETAVDEVKEELLQLQLATRTGDRNFLDSRARLEQLRVRRYHLERQRENLRGWLTCRDPYLAGGYYPTVSDDRLPDDGFSLPAPREPKGSASAAETLFADLGDALGALERCQRKLEESQALVLEGQTAMNILGPSVAQATADRKRAEAAVAFLQERLRRLSQDYEGDVQAARVQLDRAQDQAAAGTLDRARFTALRRALRQARAEAVDRGRRAARAAVATSASTVALRTRRAGATNWADGAGHLAWAPLDTWLAWGAAVLLLLCLIVPLLDDGTPPIVALRSEAAEPLRPLVWGLIASAALFAGAGLVPHRGVRGGLFCALWFVTSLAGIYALHSAAYVPGAVGETLHRDGVWLWMLRPGMVMVVLAELAILAAAWIAWTPLGGLLRLCLVLTAVAAAVLAAGVTTDFGGYLLPKVYISEEARPIRVDDRFRYAALVTVGNAGKRSFWLAADKGAANTYQYHLEREIAEGVWAAVELPEQAHPGDGPEPEIWRETVVMPGAKAVFEYELEPADYRVKLVPYGLPGEAVIKQFALARPPEPPEPPAPAPVETPASPPETPLPGPEPEPEPAAVAMVRVQLRGVMAGGERPPRFAFTIESPSGSENRDVVLKELLFARWRVEEYNRELQTVTLVSGDRLAVVKRGEWVAIEDTSKEIDDVAPPE
ncbi:MAG TPA: hypothetical protein PLO37_04175 [Candidatus Hydrogenedentes bacterium]|nr:hypothetical protein [Candidatus Hydrogenedentota bacterium]HPG66021.1 hypothetical protein [Candidatus Hydrogenedentota bacterium]